MTAGDARFDVPRYTRVEASLHLGVPLTTLGQWLRSPALEAAADGRGEVTISFAGLVEIHVLRQLRLAGLSLHRIEEAVRTLRERDGVHHPLAWRGVGHDGRDLLVRSGSGWERVRDRQRGLVAVPWQEPAAIGWADDDYAASLRLLVYAGVDVVVDPTRADGHPVVNDVQVEDVVDQVRTGAPYEEIAAKYGLAGVELEALVRVHLRPPLTRRHRGGGQNQPLEYG